MTTETTTPLEAIRANVPAELLDLAQWVTWKYEQRPNEKKPAKVLYNPATGARADSKDPRTWGTFDNAGRAYERGGYDGIGFVVAEHDPYVGVDLDGCIVNGELTDNANRWVLLLNSYTEITPSGVGVRVWIRGKKPGPLCKKAELGIEIYETKRFFTVTGNRLLDMPTTINERQTELEALYNEVFPPTDDDDESSDHTHTNPSVAVLSMDDRQLVDLMCRDHDIKNLFDGDLSARSNDHSAADLALCNHLAFWTGKDADRMNRIFKTSGLYRKKWDRADYSKNTISRAIAGCKNIYDPENYRSNNNMGRDAEKHNGNGHTDFTAPSPGPGANDDDADSKNPLDVGKTGRLALGWITDYAQLMTGLTGSPYEFNQLAGLVTAATAIQRRARLRMTFGDIYPNVFGCIIAPSSVYHKTAAIQKPRQVLQRAMMDKLFLSELMTSEGLLRQMQGQPAGVILRDEIGTLFDSNNTKYLRQLKPDLTALYDCYPYSRRLSNDEIKVDKPYLNILGATTPTRFFEGTTLTDWRDGFLARWLFVLPEGEPNFDSMVGIFREQHEGQIQRLALRLMELDRQAETDFHVTPDALALWDAWQRQAAKDAYYYGDDVTAAIVTRYSAYALKFSLILSAINGSWGEITAATMQTAIQLATSYKGYVHKLMSEKENYGISGAKLQRVFRSVALLTREKGFATTKAIMQKSGMKTNDLAPCLEKLMEIGAIDGVTSGNGKRYVNLKEDLPLKNAW
jgi:hypothetical protein